MGNLNSATRGSASMPPTNTFYNPGFCLMPQRMRSDAQGPGRAMRRLAVVCGVEKHRRGEVAAELRVFGYVTRRNAMLGAAWTHTHAHKHARRAPFL